MEERRQKERKTDYSIKNDHIRYPLLWRNADRKKEKQITLLKTVTYANPSYGGTQKERKKNRLL